MVESRRLLKKFIHEVYTQVAPGDEEVFGKVAFSKNRLDDVPDDEEDTPEEKKMYDAFRMYVMGNHDSLFSAEKVEYVRDMIRSGNYGKIFKEPNVDTAYRGMNVTKAWLAKALKVADANDIPAKGEEELRYSYVPNTMSGLSSWSSDRDAAAEFAKGQNPVSVVLHASVAANRLRFLDFNEGIYNVSPMDDMSHEYECLGLGGPIIVYKLEWFPAEYDPMGYKESWD